MAEYKHVHVDCPGCKDHFLAPVNVEELTANLKIAPKEVIKEVEVKPTWQPGVYCGDGKCTRDHRNPNYKQRPTKKCTTCGNYAPAKAANCAYCKASDDLDLEERFDPLDEDELEGLKYQPAAEMESI